MKQQCKAWDDYKKEVGMDDITDAALDDAVRSMISDFEHGCYGREATMNKLRLAMQLIMKDRGEEGPGWPPLS